MKYLTYGDSNPKLAKSSGNGYLIVNLSLAPGNTSGYETCPKRSQSCSTLCLNTCGMGIFKTTQDARIKRTVAYFENRPEFMAALYKDLVAAANRASRLGLKLACRLNTFSDIPWERVQFNHNGVKASIIGHFPDVQFYDYTAIPKRIGATPGNYHLTFSRKEDNELIAMRIQSVGYANVAVVFRDVMPETYKGYRVIDGTVHDLRFLDSNNVIVGLIAKGRARKDLSGFVVNA